MMIFSQVHEPVGVPLGKEKQHLLEAEVNFYCKSL